MGSCTFGINIFVRDTDKGKIGFRRKQGENPKTDPGACSSSSSRVHTFFLSKNHFIKEHILSNNFFFLVVASIKSERERERSKKMNDGLIIIIISRCWT